MTIHAHLVELERRHQALEEEIAEAMTHPSTDGLKIAELKRRKLLVKDEIAALAGWARSQLALSASNPQVETFQDRTAGPRQGSRRCYFVPEK